MIPSAAAFAPSPADRTNDVTAAARRPAVTAPGADRPLAVILPEAIDVATESAAMLAGTETHREAIFKYVWSGVLETGDLLQEAGNVFQHELSQSQIGASLLDLGRKLSDIGYQESTGSLHPADSPIGPAEREQINALLQSAQIDAHAALRALDSRA